VRQTPSHAPALPGGWGVRSRGLGFRCQRPVEMFMIVATPQAVRGRARPLAAALGLPEAAFQTLDRLPEFNTETRHLNLPLTVL
jgi:hypothetical protein